jgi:hypothetical protein
MKLFVEVTLPPYLRESQRLQVTLYTPGSFGEKQLITWMVDEAVLKIVSAMLKRFPQKLAFTQEKTLIEVNVPEKTFELLKNLHDIYYPIPEEVESVLNDPSLENVEKFISIQKLLLDK